MRHCGSTTDAAPDRATRPGLVGQLAPVLVLVLVLAAGSACSSDERSSAAEPSQSQAARAAERSDGPTTDRAAEGTIIQPGRPGEPAKTLPPDARLPAVQPNRADVAFVQMMIPHHAQALEMGGLARTRARDPQVRAVAQRIADAQRAEIHEMAAWLENHGFDAPAADDLEHHAHHGPLMPGMLTDTQMHRLAASQGRRFDRLFLRSMVAHHQGAIGMAGQAMDEGRDVRISEVAADIAAGQTAEIRRLRDLLQTM
ncbi:MAG: DUF305 domain-containing protein [Actinomycetota bacterium]|nr:DUF305 domain-containing protein [Actinomycetota bacterium]